MTPGSSSKVAAHVCEKISSNYYCSNICTKVCYWFARMCTCTHIRTRAGATHHHHSIWIKQHNWIAKQGTQNTNCIHTPSAGHSTSRAIETRSMGSISGARGNYATACHRIRTSNTCSIVLTVPLGHNHLQMGYQVTASSNGISGNIQ